MNTNRFEYLVRTLSRTKRKDYENYVINAVWNRLNDGSIKPASQWYVRNQIGWHLIDLYFPQINLGVECDEGHHKRNQQKDDERELTLIEVLSANNTHPYEAFHIDVTVPDEERERKINECVERVKLLVNERRNSNDFVEWTDDNVVKYYKDKQIIESTVVEYFKDKQIVKSSDDIMFPTIVDAVNGLMRTNAKAYMRGYFTPRGLDPRYKFWFPQLEIAGRAQTRGWHNVLSEDRTTITEYNDDIETNMANWESISKTEFLDYIRVTFAKVRDPISNKRAYKFVGLFELKSIDDNNVRTYVKTSDTFDASKYRMAVA